MKARTKGDKLVISPVAQPKSFPSPGEAMQQIVSWEEHADQKMRPTCDHPTRRSG